jgi:hypothetical protein
MAFSASFEVGSAIGETDMPPGRDVESTPTLGDIISSRLPEQDEGDVEENPPRRPRAVQRALDRIAALPVQLRARKIGLKRGWNGRPDIRWVCRQAGIPERTPYDFKEVYDAILDLPNHHPFDDDFVPDEAPAIATPSIDPVQTDQWLATFEEDEPRPSAEDVPAALAALASYSGILDRSSGCLPSRRGLPLLEAIARTSGLDLRLFTHPAIVALVELLVLRHGLTSAMSKTGTSYDRLSKLHRSLELFEADRIDQGRPLVRHPQGAPCFMTAIAEIGAHEDMIYRRDFRTDLVGIDRRITEALGAEVTAHGEIEIGLAVIDQFRDDVARGALTPPAPTARGIDRDRLERTLGFVSGTLTRHASLREPLEAICLEFWSEIRWQDERLEHERRVGFLLGRFDELIEGPTEKLSGLRFNRHGGVSMATLEQALKCRLGVLAITPMIEEATSRLMARVADHRGCELETAENEADLLVDIYCQKLRRRGFGAPRTSYNCGRLDHPATAAEAGIAPSQLTLTHIEKIKRVSAELRSGPATLSLTSPSRQTASDRRLFIMERALALPRFDAGLPEDPLRSGEVDLQEIAETSGFAVTAIVGRLAGLIDEKRAEVGIVPYTGEGDAITFAQLRRYGRKRRSGEAGSDSQPSRAASRTADALDVMRETLGASPADRVGTSLFSALIPHKVTADLVRWRRYHSEMILDENPDMSLSRALRLLCRARGIKEGTLHARIGCSATIRGWVKGTNLPSWAQEPLLDEVNDFFELGDKKLASFVNPDFRPLGKSSTTRGVHTHIACHLPVDFYSLSEQEQEIELAFAATRVAVQDTAFSRRQRIQTRDEYRLPIDQWPERLRDEFEIFIEAKGSQAKAAASVPDDLYAPVVRDVTMGKIANGSRGLYRAMFESFFGFLVRDPVVNSHVDVVSDATDPRIVDARRTVAAEVGYQSRGGLGIERNVLTFGILAVPEICGAYQLYRAGRSNGRNGETHRFINQCQLATRPERISQKTGTMLPAGFVRTNAEVRKALLEFASWWEEKQKTQVKLSARLPHLALNARTIDAQCDRAIAMHDVAYLRTSILKRARSEGKPLQTRNPFEPIMVVLMSRTPAAVYRAAMQRMIKNRPVTALARHMHDRDCLLVMLLFQTHFRIKNIAQLTYHEDGSGQLRKVDGKWKVVIHRSRFKSHGGEYLRHADYFEKELRDEDDLYAIIERYLALGRDHIRFTIERPKKVRRNAKGRPQGETPPDREDAGDDDCAVFAQAARDEEGDDHGDHDHDGQPDEARFFIKRGGAQFRPSVLAQRFSFVTSRYLADSPRRMRGLKGLMIHGPHALRHIAATDALRTQKTWEAAAEALLDSVETVKLVYVFFAPSDVGERSAAVSERGRAMTPAFVAHSGFYAKAA